MKNYKNTEKAYNAIFKLIVKNKDLVRIDLERLQTASKLHLLELKLREEYGLNLPEGCIKSTDWSEIAPNMYICRIDGMERRISWSDDGNQPDNELLLKIGFPTGAYIFGEDCLTEVFNKFFVELKSYSPKYSDTVNHCLYFTMDNAKFVYNAYKEIYNKYSEQAKYYREEKRIADLKKELEKLEKNNVFGFMAVR